MKKSMLILATLLLAVVAAVASNVRRDDFQSAFKRTSATQCDPITVTNCSTDSGPACNTSQTVYNENSCSVVLYKVN